MFVPCLVFSLCARNMLPICPSRFQVPFVSNEFAPCCSRPLQPHFTSRFVMLITMGLKRWCYVSKILMYIEGQILTKTRTSCEKQRTTHVHSRLTHLANMPHKWFMLVPYLGLGSYSRSHGYLARSIASMWTQVDLASQTSCQICGQWLATSEKKHQTVTMPADVSAQPRKLIQWWHVQVTLNEASKWFYAWSVKRRMVRPDISNQTEYIHHCGQIRNQPLQESRPTKMQEGPWGGRAKAVLTREALLHNSPETAETIHHWICASSGGTSAGKVPRLQLQWIASQTVPSIWPQGSNLCVGSLPMYNLPNAKT